MSFGKMRDRDPSFELEHSTDIMELKSEAAILLWLLTDDVDRVFVCQLCQSVLLVKVTVI